MLLHLIGNTGYVFVMYKMELKALIEEHSAVCYRRRQWHPTPALSPGKSHGRRSLVGCSPWGLEESDTNQQLHFHFSLSCTGEGNGNPLQCSCLKNPTDGGAWWAAVYGVALSQTRLKRLSSSGRRRLTTHWHQWTDPDKKINKTTVRGLKMIQLDLSNCR